MAILVFLECSLIRGSDIVCCPISLLPDIITSVGSSGDIRAWSCQAGVRIVACGAAGLVEQWSPLGSETALLLVGGKGVLHSSEASETPGFTFRQQHPTEI